MGHGEPKFRVGVGDVAECEGCGDEHENVQEYYLGDEAGLLGYPTFCPSCYDEEVEKLEDEPYELRIPGW